MSEARSLLFLSCDIVGSTKYKQQESTIWQQTFLSFYREFPQILGDAAHEAGHGLDFELWKAVGDELIFTVTVHHEEEVYAALRTWLDAMHRYETGSLADVSLATKGGAFIATFPGPDSESSIPRNPKTEVSDKGVVELNDEALAERRPDLYMYDFFGPSVDTGFRVISACSQRYFTLSVEVAWAVAACAVEAGADANRYPLTDLLLLDAREFKGVWGGRDYPVFAIDRHHEDLVNVAMSKLRDRSVNPIDVLNLCKECSSKDNWPSQLYLPASDHTSFKKTPQDSLAALRSNSMDGAETVPETDSGSEQLEEDPPL